MSTAALAKKIVIPGWVSDFDSFCEWSRTDEFPQRGRFCFLRGGLWVDLSMETLKHNQVKGQYAVVLGGLAESADLGQFLHDRFGLKYPEIRLATEPDGMFVSWGVLKQGRARFIKAAKGDDWVDLEGTPDMALEVVSDSSVEKDTVILFHSYWEAGIPEYWLVDVREDRLRFDIFRHTEDGYVAIRPRGGWLKSGVFGKSFRLSGGLNKVGRPAYKLSYR